MTTPDLSGTTCASRERHLRAACRRGPGAACSGRGIKGLARSLTLLGR